MVNTPKEITELADAFASFRKGDKDKDGNQSIVSTEVLTSSLMQDSHKHYFWPDGGQPWEEGPAENEMAMPSEHFQTDMARD